jgi:succinyl-diaminopimelate desuccinylase
MTRTDPLTSADEAIARRVRARRDDLVALTQDLVRIPTINPPGEAYRPCAELVGERLRKRGFAVDYFRAEGAIGDSDRYPRTNVVARLEGRSPGACVHFNSHIDVVEVGRGWTVDPFGGEVRNGRVYGRGACDMKGGLAASIIAVEAILDGGIPFCGALEISGTVDEETGGYGGVAWLAERGFFSRPRVDYVIIPEPLNPDRVCIGHRGVWWGEVETLGRIAHGSMPFLGVSAIASMGRFLAKLEAELRPRLAARFTAMPVVPEGARSSTLNINSIHGGQPEFSDGLPSPCVADSCRVVLDRRFLVEESLDAVRAEIRDILDRLASEVPDFRYRLRELWSIEPTLTPSDSPLVQTLLAEIRRVLGQEPREVASPGTYDQKHIARIGKLKDCVAYGPGLIELAHQPDEWVGIDDMVASAEVMARAALRLSQAPQAPR